MENTTEPGQTTPSAEQFDSQSFFREHLVRAEDGQLEIQGNDLGGMEMALLETEKRRRGSQAATSREKTRADRAELANTKAMEGIRTVQQPEPIDPALKYSDPDKYIELTLASKQHDPYKDVFDTASAQAAQEVGATTVDTVIAQHNQTHPGRQVTLEMLDQDLPPRLVNEFKAGKMSPASFLEEASDILYRPTEVENQTIPVTPDLGAVGGQTSPTDDGSNDTLIANYASAIF